MTIRKRMTTVICLIIIIIMCLIGAISNFSYKSVIANASTRETFVGTSGSPSGASLYNATNTYNVKNDIFTDTGVFLSLLGVYCF